MLIWFLYPTFSQVFTNGVMDSLSMLQSRVACLENVVERVAQDLVHREERCNSATSKLTKQSQSMHSPRVSTCTPRPSIDIRSRQPSLLSLKSSDIWEENAFDRSLANNSTKQGTEMWTNTKITRNPAGRDIQKSSRLGTQQKMGYSQIRTDPLFGSASSTNARQSGLESKNGLWKRVKGFLCEGDLDSAYMEAICSGDEIALVELLDKTGPVLESLSSKTVSDLLSILTSYLLEQRFMNSILPWLQQASPITL